jgi:hypothetical protein
MNIMTTMDMIAMIMIIMTTNTIKLTILINRIMLVMVTPMMENLAVVTMTKETKQLEI